MTSPTAGPDSAERAGPAGRASPWRTRFARRTYLSGAFWLAGLLLSWATNAPDRVGWLALRVDAAGLAYTAAALVGGANFFGAGLRAARSYRLDMNFLMSAALLAALLIGEAFEAATLAALFSLAELLERFAVDRGRRSLARLLELAPEKADRLRPDGTIETVPVELLLVGDRVRIRPGDRVPVDGRVFAGMSAVNEATITGESLPRPKRAGDAVFAGTMNGEGAIDVEATADAAHSTLARIVQLIQQAEGRRAPVEEFVKRFARVYTPVVTGFAVIVMVGPPLLLGAPTLEWFVRGITLLVIACPCALVIATPVTVVSALTSAARNGVLIKGGEHLESLGGMRALAIDKTGTLTTGSLVMTDLEVEAGDPVRLFRQVVSLEALSEHPVAEAIMRYAAERGVRPDGQVSEFSSVPGQGVRGTVEGTTLLVGTEEFVGAAFAAPRNAEPDLVRIYVTAAGDGMGTITLRDEVRPEAPRVVKQLHAMGIRPIVMLTGDSAAPAQAVGRAVGADAVRWRLLPQEKVEAVRELRGRYGTVGMLGDGVNDAPALATAAVGMAMGGAGSPATIETADVALMADDLNQLPYAVRLAHRARRIIRFSIALALGAKLLLGIGAVFGVVSLAAAVLVGDMGGSLAVTINALRLARMRADG
ncbi:MAG: heavy metal translocating P-type ATPase [Gemmatimonadales bacterium]